VVSSKQLHVRKRDKAPSPVELATAELSSRHYPLAGGFSAGVCAAGLLWLQLAGCGALSPGYDERYDYLIHTQNGTSHQHQQFRLLVDDFNRSIGREILSYSNEPTEGHSPMSLVNQLERSTGKLGFAGVVVTTLRSGLKTVRTESMRIELDRDYVLRRLPSQPGQKTYAELRLLFFHEVGHGLGLGHESQINDVMYPDLNGDKDYPAFFSRVQILVESREQDN
jgi:hypothetical protein